MPKKILYISLIIITLFILDNTIIPMISIKNIFPSTLFVFLVCYSIINGYAEGIIIGVAAGLLQDIYMPGVFGVNMLVNMIVGILAAKVGESIFKEKAIIPILSTFLLSMLKSIMIYMLLILIKKSNNFLYLIPYKGLYDMVLAVFMYKITLKFSQSKTIKKEWRF
ncbi:rod shape-determining protein MreD [Clostridium culturomicium]|uniref:rod shape-determining protein MreD n=1 Tax=Clostridium culturomicium TaxID=1499683 RepID=UPI0018CF3E36|nr:rod shape-determining protein MreD [Clostridium culturomicium]